MFHPSRGIVTSLAMGSAFTYSAIRSRMAWAMVSGLGTTAASRAGLYGVGVKAPLSRRIGRVEIVETLVGQPGGDLGADAERCERLVDDQQPAGLGDRLADRVEIERGDRPRIDQLDRDAFAGESLADLQRLVHHQGQGDDRDVASLDGRRRPGRTRSRNRRREPGPSRSEARGVPGR